MRPWMENVSIGVGDDWQYERDKRELMELRDGVREYAKRRLAGCNKLHREETERDDESLETLEKINRLVRKLPLPRQRNTVVAATRTPSVVRQPRKKKPIDQEVTLKPRTPHTPQRSMWIVYDVLTPHLHHIIFYFIFHSTV